MALPGFPSFLSPVLEVFADGTPHSLKDVHETIAQVLNLTELDRLYRPRFLGQFFELSSCGSFEGKQGLVSLPRGLEAEPFDQPLFVVALAEFFERFGQFFQGFEVPHPE
jgi:hypothetical protein